MQAAIEAVAEVGNPTVVATLTVVAALLPMLFVSGLMGPYMAPIPANASAAMLFSFFVAMVVAPWLLLKLAPSAAAGGWRASRRGTARPAVPRGRVGWCCARAHAPGHSCWRSGIATIAACAMFYTEAVTVKLLPFDNKSELQVVLNLPEGSSLEDTERSLFAAAEIVRGLPEVRSVQAYAGTAAPFNFNGLVRHYYMRKSPELGDLQINLADKSDRDRSSHAIALDLRQRLAALKLPEAQHAAGGRGAAGAAGAGHSAGGDLWTGCEYPSRGRRRGEEDLPLRAVHRRCGGLVRPSASAAAHQHRSGPAGVFRRRAERCV